MGVWYMHTSIGNILGTVIPSIWATCDGPWGWSFVVPGFIIIGVSVPVFILLVPGMYGECVSGGMYGECMCAGGERGVRMEHVHPPGTRYIWRVCVCGEEEEEGWGWSMY